MKVLPTLCTVAVAALCVAYSTASPSVYREVRMNLNDRVQDVEVQDKAAEAQNVETALLQRKPTGLAYVGVRIRNGFNHLGHQFKKFVDGKR